MRGTHQGVPNLQQAAAAPTSHRPARSAAHQMPLPRGCAAPLSRPRGVRCLGAKSGGDGMRAQCAGEARQLRQLETLAPSEAFLCGSVRRCAVHTQPSGARVGALNSPAQDVSVDPRIAPGRAGTTDFLLLQSRAEYSRARGGQFWCAHGIYTYS
jgi:hypothetical protein